MIELSHSNRELSNSFVGCPSVCHTLEIVIHRRHTWLIGQKIDEHSNTIYQTRELLNWIIELCNEIRELSIWNRELTNWIIEPSNSKSSPALVLQSSINKIMEREIIRILNI